MSSIDSSTSSSRLRQLGLYRSIDARTEEFLRLSKKRQIRQGCACAAISTTITVTIVIVILLIYEYAIAVEWSSVQRWRINGTTNVTKDSPFAERLDRSFFGFDQDYYERMPLLVNALQESNYVDPLLEMSRPINRRRYNKTVSTIKSSLATDTSYRQSKIRRTSPRPFIFEYRSPTPLPFSKTYGSRSWVDSYRNAQRLQNIRQVIKYLEKTINAKMSDVYSKTTGSHASVAFTGVYVEPMVNRSNADYSQNSDMQQQGSDKIESYHANHQSDPLFRFKPNNPSDVNLLADGLWRFAPLPGFSFTEHKSSVVPMFKRIPGYKKKCINGKCNENIEEADSKVVELLETSSEYTTTPPNKPKSFSLMVNLFPYKPKTNVEYYTPEAKTLPPIEKIYFTTSKPVRFQFRRKSNVSARRNYYYKKPKYLIQKKNEFEERLKARTNDKTTPAPELDEATKMIVHVNVYSPEKKTDMRKKAESATDPTTTTTTTHGTVTPLTDLPFEISSGKVEDFHDGSSGVIPVPERTEPPSPPIVPQITTMIPFFDTDTASSESTSQIWPTNPPEIVKFGAEDAKIPDQYLNLMETTTAYPVTEINRRTSVNSYLEKELETLIIRLKNGMTTSTSTTTLQTTTISTTTEENEEITTIQDEEEEDQPTTVKTYVPQTNGHARSFNSRPPFTTERNRKKKIEMSVTGFRTYVPMYVEIKRNKTKSSNEDE